MESPGIPGRFKRAKVTLEAVTQLADLSATMLQQVNDLNAADTAAVKGRPAHGERPVYCGKQS